MLTMSTDIEDTAVLSESQQYVWEETLQDSRAVEGGDITNLNKLSHLMM